MESKSLGGRYYDTPEKILKQTEMGALSSSHQRLSVATTRPACKPLLPTEQQAVCLKAGEHMKLLNPGSYIGPAYLIQTALIIGPSLGSASEKILSYHLLTVPFSGDPSNQIWGFCMQKIYHSPKTKD